MSKRRLRPILGPERLALIQAREEGFSRRDIAAVFDRSLSDLHRIYKGRPPPADGFKSQRHPGGVKPKGYDWNRLYEIQARAVSRETL